MATERIVKVGCPENVVYGATATGVYPDTMDYDDLQTALDSEARNIVSSDEIVRFIIYNHDNWVYDPYSSYSKGDIRAALRYDDSEIF